MRAAAPLHVACAPSGDLRRAANIPKLDSILKPPPTLAEPARPRSAWPLAPEHAISPLPLRLKPSARISLPCQDLRPLCASAPWQSWPAHSNPRSAAATIRLSAARPDRCRRRRRISRSRRGRRGCAWRSGRAGSSPLRRPRPPSCPTLPSTRNCCSSSCCPRSRASAATCNWRRRATWRWRDPRATRGSRGAPTEIASYARLHERRAGGGAAVVRDRQGQSAGAPDPGRLAAFQQQAAGGQAASAGHRHRRRRHPAHGFLQLHGLLSKHPDKNAV